MLEPSTTIHFPRRRRHREESGERPAEIRRTIVIAAVLSFFLMAAYVVATNLLSLH